MSLFRRHAPWIAATFVMATSLGFVSRLSAVPVDDDDRRPDPQALARADELSAAFEYAAERVQKSVVSINATIRVRNIDGRGGNPLEGTPFEQFFGFRQFDMRDMPREGSGSGFIVDKDGHVVTNAHVVRGAEKVTVTLSDQRQFAAEVLASDDKTDLAVIKIDAEDLVPVQFASSSELRLGQWVIAAGNPYGLSSSITAGIISAKGRRNLDLAAYEDYIQTDAAINPGNSGGPLVDLTGRVIGINTAIFTRTGGSMGIGFAIPADLAKPIIDDLIADREVSRGWLGVAIQDMSPQLRKSYDFQGNGVLVGEVTPDGPAEDAGLRAEDILTKIDGKPVKDTVDLRNAVAAIRPGTTIEVELTRDGESHTVTVELGKQPADLDVTPRAPRPEQGLEEDSLGITVKDLTPRLRQQLGMEDAATGAVITRVERDSAAAMAGLRIGDIVVKVGKTEIQNAQEFKEAVASIDLADGVRLVVKSNGTQRIVFIQSNR